MIWQVTEANDASSDELLGGFRAITDLQPCRLPNFARPLRSVQQQWSDGPDGYICFLQRLSVATGDGSIDARADINNGR